METDWKGGHVAYQADVLWDIKTQVNYADRKDDRCKVLSILRGQIRN